MGVNTNFRMPDILSIGMGGGNSPFWIRRKVYESVGYEITKKALLFGGDVLISSYVVTLLGHAFDDKAM
ncbi:hypothetical protein COL91_10985 [Bacillus pseudomycoides]|nr:hypothetical protein COO02_13120 [Bacillus pseudomycoides]PEI93384.1 hypothetical protein CN679_07800 [Bacillus pseudomycoides]PGA91170.1 hypothetical protein COL91_10985 [Bacillus pseudomycoides]PHF31641.1 hypothetical protein COF72_27645 [Bacillus pseudomycoides]